MTDLPAADRPPGDEDRPGDLLRFAWLSYANRKGIWETAVMPNGEVVDLFAIFREGYRRGAIPPGSFLRGGDSD